MCYVGVMGGSKDNVYSEVHMVWLVYNLLGPGCVCLGVVSVQGVCVSHLALSSSKSGIQW